MLDLHLPPFLFSAKSTSIHVCSKIPKINIKPEQPAKERVCFNILTLKSIDNTYWLVENINFFTVYIWVGYSPYKTVKRPVGVSKICYISYISKIYILEKTLKMEIKTCVLFYYFSLTQKIYFWHFRHYLKTSLARKLTVKFLFNELSSKIELYLALQLQNLTLRLGTNPPSPSSLFWVKPSIYRNTFLSLYLFISIEDIVVSNQKVLISVNVLYFSFSI